ncbi:YbhB/YbcL family Raf kinase inhibitor-like protein [Candidatus Saccharibacteria bacterium]|nr:YbhB/YbcL family Raf kinase inhibitor-like protein [Candidatus Saccharibacteria bacterium]
MDATATQTDFNLISQVFRDGAPIPPQYTCKGQNVSPPLTIMGTPQNTKSLALVMHDPDAVSGDFTHWLVWDVPASTDMIGAHSLPPGAVQGANDGGQNKYTGPCPPAGTGVHRYFFELYALDKTLGLPPQTKRPALEQAMEGHVLAKAKLTGLFGG